MCIVKIKDLQSAIINEIAKKSGKSLTLEEYKKLDSVEIGRLLGITKMGVTITKRLCYIIVYLSRKRYKIV